MTLALAIAANGIVFGLTDVLLLRPLPFGNAKRLVTICTVDTTEHTDRVRVSLPDYVDIAARNTAFDEVIAVRLGQQLSLTGADEPRAASAAAVTVNAFRAWQVPAIAGRLFGVDRADSLTSGLIVLSHHFWVAHFGGDAG